MGADRWRGLAGFLICLVALGVAVISAVPSSLASPVSATRTATPVATLTISNDAARLVRELNQVPYGAITRWHAPMRIWVDSGFARTDLEEAISLWESAIGSGQQFVIVNDADSANVRFRLGTVPNGVCGYEGPTLIQNHVIMAGEGLYSSTSGCTGTGIPAQTALAHGIGHILGIAGHTASATDVMSSSYSLFSMSSTLADAMRYIYPPSAGVGSTPAGNSAALPVATSLPTRTSTRTPTHSPTPSPTSTPTSTPVVTPVSTPAEAPTTTPTDGSEG
jgi:hypothetical protein